jgi:hypothetical protein
LERHKSKYAYNLYSNHVGLYCYINFNFLIMTTSLKISKDLAAVGFKSYEGVKLWAGFKELKGKSLGGHDAYYIGFHLETIWNALPKKVNFAILYLSHEAVWYDCYGCEEFRTNKEKGESLADTAARLLIKLVEKGIINFNKSLS